MLIRKCEKSPLKTGLNRWAGVASLPVVRSSEIEEGLDRCTRLRAIDRPLSTW